MKRTKQTFNVQRNIAWDSAYFVIKKHDNPIHLQNPEEKKPENAKPVLVYTGLEVEGGRAESTGRLSVKRGGGRWTAEVKV